MPKAIEDNPEEKPAQEDFQPKVITEFRPHTPIIEDPKEDRRPSMDPSEAEDLKPLVSIDSPSEAPSTSSATEPETGQKTDSDAVQKTESDMAGPSAPEEAEAKEEKTKPKPKESPDKPATQDQPIFKPLTTDKGKSKVYGKTIGGWI